jgi:polyferredoxin
MNPWNAPLARGQDQGTGERLGRFHSWATALLGWRFYPGVFQWAMLAALAVIVLSALFAPNNTGQNLGTVLTWTAWWPLLPLSFLLAGRSWCAVCPFTLLTDTVQRAVGARFPAPRFLRHRGPWVVAALFVAVTFAHEAWRIGDDAHRTAYLLLAFTVAVIFFAAFFDRRTFCRDVCFVGAFAANYSRAGIVKLRADRDRCRGCRTHACYHGSSRAPACPVFILAPEITDSGSCHLCGNCVKNCPHDAIRLSIGLPTAELWSLREPRLADAVMAATVVGVVLLQQVSLLRSWVPLVEATAAVLHVDPYVWYPLVYAVLLAAFILVPLAGLGAAGLVAQKLSGAARDGDVRAGVLANAACFGYAMIPLALAGHLAHSLYHLLTRSRTLPFVVLAAVGRFPARQDPAWLPRSSVFPIEMAVLIAGAAGSLYVVHRLARARPAGSAWGAFLPHAVLLLALLAASVWVAAAVSSVPSA